MKFNLTVKMDNAAFEFGPTEELGRILRDAADKVEFMSGDATDERPLLDVNGNIVGHFSFTL